MKAQEVSGSSLFMVWAILAIAALDRVCFADPTWNNFTNSWSPMSISGDWTPASAMYLGPLITDLDGDGADGGGFEATLCEQLTGGIENSAARGLRVGGIEVGRQSVSERHC